MKKLLAYNIYKHATSVNFDTSYVFVSCVVFEPCQFLFLGGGARTFGGYVQRGKYHRTF